MKLNKNQKKIKKKIYKFYKSNDDKNGKMLVIGPSGSGKTTTIVKSLIEINNINVCFCAFTNKATKVLKNMVKNLIEDKNKNIKMDFLTIHSLLKLEPNTIEINDKNKKDKSIINHIFENVYDWKNLKKLLINDRSEILNPKNNEDLLLFIYNYSKLESLAEFDIIVIDECSTISRELYLYIESTIRFISDKFNHKIKIIFLGDYYQLPPVKEYRSIIFDLATKEKWKIYKLIKIMRSKTTQIDKVNLKFLNFINRKIKLRSLKVSDIEFPHNILKSKDFLSYNNLYIDSQKTFLNKYAKLQTEDKIIITYSNNNCDKINVKIQKIIDEINNINRNPDPDYSDLKYFNRTTPMIWFKVNDRVMVKSPIETPSYRIIEFNLDKTESISSYINLCIEDESVTPVYCVSFSDNLKNGKRKERKKIYNGDIFVVKKEKKIKVRTALNSLDDKYSEIPASFIGQILTLVAIEDLPQDRSCNPNITRSEAIELIHVDTLEVEKTRRIIKKKLSYKDYIEIMHLFRKNFTTFKRGYCVTCYKIQGSEFKHVFVNLKSFWSSLLPDNKKNKDNARLLFSAFYTAATRSTSRLYLYW